MVLLKHVCLIYIQRINMIIDLQYDLYIVIIVHLICVKHSYNYKL